MAQRVGNFRSGWLDAEPPYQSGVSGRERKSLVWRSAFVRAGAVRVYSLYSNRLLA